MNYIEGSIIASIVILVMALLGYFYTPKTPSAFGYKTPRSLKNNNTWSYANNLAKTLFLLVSVLFIVIQIILYLYCEHKHTAFNYSFLFLTIGSVAVLPITEIMLNLKFDKHGKRRPENSSDFDENIS